MSQTEKDPAALNEMDHPTPGRLSDYIRGMLSGDARLQLEKHLAHCPDCEQWTIFLRKLQESASEVAVPEELVGSVKALFVKPGLDRPPLLTRVLACLVPRDTASLQFAGVRSAQPASHHSLYRWNDYFIDLRMDKEPESASVCLLGQIASQLTPESPLGGIPVTLAAGSQVISETRCNSLGEFSIDFVPDLTPAHSLHVRFDVVEAEVSIDVPLNKLKI